MLNINLEQLGILGILGGMGTKRPITIGLAYDATIAAGGSTQWTYSAPSNAKVVITDIVATHTGGTLSATIKDSGTDVFLTSLGANTTNIPLVGGIARSMSTANSTPVLQYPIILQPNGSLTIAVNNTSGSTAATGVFATMSGVLCPS